VNEVPVLAAGAIIQPGGLQLGTHGPIAKQGPIGEGLQ